MYAATVQRRFAALRELVIPREPRVSRLDVGNRNAVTNSCRGVITPHDDFTLSASDDDPLVTKAGDEFDLASEGADVRP